jgi:hypothetical protein
MDYPYSLAAHGRASRLTVPADLRLFSSSPWLNVFRKCRTKELSRAEFVDALAVECFGPNLMNKQ